MFFRCFSDAFPQLFLRFSSAFLLVLRDMCECAWNMNAIGMENVRNMFGICVDRVWDVYGIRVENV